MPVPTRYDLIRQRKNNFKRQSMRVMPVTYKITGFNVNPPETVPTPEVIPFGLPGFINAPHPVGGLQVMQEDPIYASMQESSFTVTSNTNNISAGETVAMTLNVNGVSDNSSISYTISGIDLSDISNSEQLDLYESGSVIYGDFYVVNGTSTISIILEQSVATQTMVFYLTNGKSNIINISINTTLDVLGAEDNNSVGTENLDFIEVEG